MIIVNADDFGGSNLINRAIIDSFKAGIISSTTIMANMPGFEEASELAHENGIIKKVGIHLNISQGKPLTNDIQKMNVFCDNDGVFSYQRRSFRHFTAAEKRALANEVTAQIQRCRRNGLSLTHADSHEHIHTDWPLFSIISKVLIEQKIKFVRISRNMGDIRGLKKLYKMGFNFRLGTLGFRKTDYFGDVNALEFLIKSDPSPNKSIEIMVHPYYDDSGNLIDVIDRYLLIPRLKDVFKNLKIEPYPLNDLY